MALPFYGLASSLALDPIEKKPLHHFLPGSQVLSAGFLGCNMRCPFCQNWGISQDFPERPDFARALPPDALVAAALEARSPSVAYTYSEPSVHIEYLLEAMSAAREAGLKNVLVTNGCLSAGPARTLLEHCDAANVDLKTWSAELYEKRLGGSRDAVLEFIRIASGLCHLEVTTLVVPGLSDSAEGIDSIARFLAGLSPSIPFHLSAYHPDWKEDSPPTPASLLDQLARQAREELSFVYMGNVSNRGADTICPGCGTTVIRRRGYRTEPLALRRSGSAGLCSSCGRDLNIIV
jgi:pyruvate formate lyase activating enzyme